MGSEEISDFKTRKNESKHTLSQNTLEQLDELVRPYSTKFFFTSSPLPLL